MDPCPHLPPCSFLRLRRARRLLGWLGERDRRGLDHLRSLLADRPLVALELLPTEPTDLGTLEGLGRQLQQAIS